MSQRRRPSRKKSYRQVDRTRRNDTRPATLSTYQKALRLHQSGDLEKAEAAYRRLLNDHPDSSEIWHAAGLLALQRDEPELAVERLQRATRHSTSPAFQAALGVAELMRGDPGAFRIHSRKAADNGYRETRLYQRAAQALDRQQRWNDSASAWEAAAVCSPHDTGIQLDWAAAEKLAGRNQQAVQLLARLCEQNPEMVEAHNNLGVIHQEAGNDAAAIQCFDRALSVRPGEPMVSYNLALAYQTQDDCRRAECVVQTALENHPDDPALLFAHATLLPTIYESHHHLAECRQQLEQRVSALESLDPRWNPLTFRANAPFRIAYQGLQDRRLACQLGRLFTDPAENESDGEINVIEPDWRRRRLRIGFLSSCFRVHTVARLTRGLIAEIDSNRFECHVYSLGPAFDSMSQWIAERSASFESLRRSPLNIWQRLRHENLDMLIFPDVGMDATTTAVARTRLAPVQIAMWGHPVTTGIPTIDYFVSGQHLETPEADEHYSEQLVRLPRLPTYYYRPPIQPVTVDRSQWPIPETSRWYLCPQSPFKLHPDFDEVLAGILQADPGAALLLLEGTGLWRQRLEERLHRSLPSAALQRVHFLERQTNTAFLHLLAAADVMLDPLHFGGGNTSYEAAAIGIPVITLPSEFLRGRVTSGIYHQMGLDDTLVDSKQTYVETAVRLANERATNRRLRDRIRSRAAAIFEDRQAVQALEQFLQEAADRAATTGTA